MTAPPVASETNLDLPHDGLLGHIIRMNLAVTAALEAIAQQHGIALADYLVLGVIRRSKGGRSAPGAIAGVLGRTTGGMSLTLDRLAAAGWLERSADPDDGRRVIVVLTVAGRRLAEEVNRDMHAWERSLGLPDTEASLDALESVTAAVTTAVTAAVTAQELVLSDR